MSMALGEEAMLTVCKGLCGEPNVHLCKQLVPGLSNTPKPRDAQVPLLKRLHIYMNPTDVLLQFTSSLGNLQFATQCEIRANGYQTILVKESWWIGGHASVQTRGFFCFCFFFKKKTICNV